MVAAVPAWAAEGGYTGASPTVVFVGWLVALAIGIGLGWYGMQHLGPRSGARAGAASAGDAPPVEEAKPGTPEAMVARFTVPTLLYNRTGDWLAANAAAKQFFGDRGMTAAEATPKEFATHLRACLKNRKKDDSLESQVGTYWLGWTLVPLEGFVRVTITDITDRKGREVELMRERDAALKAARTTSEFVATLSHDIRVPMNGVLGMANLLLESGLTAQQRDLARSVVDSAESVITLTDELLDLAKIEAGKLEINPQPVELGAVLDELLRSQAARAAEKGLDLSCDVDATLPAMVQVDPTRLRQILANLLSNALKFTERGEVFVRIWNEPRGSATGTPELRFAVRDTGIGIAPENRDRLFQAFGQGDASTYGRFGGTGLGLVTSRRIAELMGGRVWFESEPNRGSTFFLALPFLPIEGSAPPAWTQAQPALDGKEVVLVEDNARLCATLAAWFTQWGARAIPFQSAQEAHTWLGSGGRGAIAVVDLDLPNNAALPLLRALGQSRPAPRLVATAARLLDPAAQSAGAEVLLKPLTPYALVDLLRRPPAPPPPAPPPVPPPPAPAAPAVAAKPPPAAPKARVIVADDDVVNQKVMRTYLERLGCEVRLVSNGVDALAQIAVSPPDILFLDIMMPRLDGIGTVREIRKMEAERQKAGQPIRRIPIVAITAKVMPGDRENGLAAGFDDYATKPINDTRLRESLHRFLPDFQPPGPLAAGTTLLATPQIALVDRARLTELSSGDPGAMREIAALFFERMAALLPEIEATLSAGDLVEARRHAHTGAGSCATCGVMQGQNAMRRLERSIEAGQIDHSRELINETRRVLSSARESLADLLPPAP